MALTHTEQITSEASPWWSKHYRVVSSQQSETLTDLDCNKERFYLKIVFAEQKIYLPVNEVPWFLNTIREMVLLTQLKTGWDGEDAKPVSIESLEIAAKLLDKVVTKNTPSPYIFPLPDGGIQFEWHTEEIDLEIEVSGNSEVVVLYRGPDNNAIAWEARLEEAVGRLKEYVQQLS